MKQAAQNSKIRAQGQSRVVSTVSSIQAEERRRTRDGLRLVIAQLNNVEMWCWFLLCWADVFRVPAMQPARTPQTRKHALSLLMSLDVFGLEKGLDAELDSMRA